MPIEEKIDDIVTQIYHGGTGVALLRPSAKKQIDQL